MKKFKVTVNGQAYEVEVEEVGTPDTAAASVPVEKPVSAPAPVREMPKPEPVKPAPVTLPGKKEKEVSEHVAAPKGAVPKNAITVKAPMPGKISFVKASIGQGVAHGDVLVVLEAMKMQNDITAPSEGTVIDMRVKLGDNVKTGDVLAVIS